MDSTDHDDLAALDFSHYGQPDPDTDDSDALDFAVADVESGESTVAALGEYSPVVAEPAESELNALSEEADTEDDDPLERFTFTVTNPPGTVTVSAIMDGSVRQIDVSPKVTSMTETQLAEEILVVADLARQKAQAGEHTYITENSAMPDVPQLGFDGDEVVRYLVEDAMGLPTPAQAQAVQAEVFATRYAGDND